MSDDGTDRESSVARIAGAFALLLALGSLAPLAASAASFGSAPGLGGLAGQTRNGHDLAQGVGGVLTEDGVAAYFEALEFVLGQLGQPMQIDAQSRAAFTQRLASSFAQLPPATQQALANARQTWTQYANAWTSIGIEEKQAFAFDVLALAYGEQAAAQALGLDSGGGADYSGYEGMPDMSGDYEGSDCWAAAGCSFDEGTGSYSYEDFGSEP
jgi:hypothetical protein